MAQGNIIQGQASGKLGDTVLMVRNGTQVSRVYTTSGARSGEAASFAARLQRVRFGSASNQWQLYRYICTRMFRKGRRTNQSDYNYFVKRNVDFLPYFTKLENADGVCCMMPGQFSEGTLGRIELLSIYGTNASTSRAYTVLSDTINPIGSSVRWDDNIIALKTALRSAYVNARKITYLLVSTTQNVITETSESFISQFFQHIPVVIDLFAESAAGENEMTIKQFFASKIYDPTIKALFQAQTTGFNSTTSVINIVSPDEASDAVVNSLGVLFFATNDLVSDAYTTILPADSVNTVKGVYSVWGAYRSEDSLQVACDSYGYQSGVMRDDVASVANANGVQMHEYASRLAALDSDEAVAFQRLAASAAPISARVVMTEDSE